jgi:uncharacterized protein (TIGR03437 family)
MNGFAGSQFLRMGGFAARIVSLGVMGVCLAAQTVSTSTLVFGSGDDSAGAAAVDSHGYAYVAGSTNSPDFPVTRALFSQLPEPALRVSSDGRAFTAAPLPVLNVVTVTASSDGNLILAGTERGPYRSTNGGATWTPSSSGLPGQTLALAVDPVNSGIAYAVAITSSASFQFSTNWTWTIYKSTDAGDTWQHSADFTLSPVTAMVSRILINPRNPSIVYAFVNSALLRSDDGGGSWQRLGVPAAQDPSGFTSPTGFAIASSQPDIAYATTFLTPLMKSADGGLTWQPAAPIASAGENAIAVDPRNPSTVWLVNAAGIQQSVDGGVTFRRVASPGDGSWRSIAISETDSNRVYASDLHNVYATFDGGATWSIVASGQINGVFAAPAEVFAAASVTPTVFLSKFDSTLKQTIFSTFIGPGTVYRIATDVDGNVVLTGTTRSHSFPTTANALQRDFTSASAGFVVKIRADDGSLLYSTLLDGLQPYGMALAPDGNPVIAGAASAGVPVTAHAFQPAAPGPCNREKPSWALAVPQESTHAFVAKLDLAGGKLIYATYLSGSCGDEARAVAVDSTGAAYIGGETYSPDFPISPDAMIASFPTLTYGGFVAKLAPAGDRLLYSSFIGGGAEAAVNAMALDSAGTLYLAGATQGPATEGAYHRPAGSCPPTFGLGPAGATYFAPGDDGFVMKLQPSSSAPVFLATIGGSCQDLVSGVSLDSAGNIWMAGRTISSDFPTARPVGGLGAPNAAGQPGFLAELDPTGANLLYSDVANSPGVLAAAPGGNLIYFAESASVPQKTGGAIFVAGIDASQLAPIALDMLIPYSGAPPVGIGYFGPQIAPGQAIRLEGRGIGPATLADAKTAPGSVQPTIAGVQVTFNGVTAPLVSVQANEIVCLAPFELDGLSSASIEVRYAGQASNVFPVLVVPQNIDVIAVANQDGSLNSESHPAAPGTVVGLYITGAGQTNPPSADGTVYTTPYVIPNRFPQVFVNGLAEQPAFVGASVGMVAGILQVNLFVPDPGAGAFDAVSLGARIWASH